MILETFPVGAFQCNCTILGDEATGEAIVVDPGDEPEKILGRLKALGLEARYAFHTHAHLDHVMATRRLKEEVGSEILLHPGDRELYDNLQVQARIFGIRTADPLPVDRWVAHGDKLGAGAVQGEILHTPGHTPGSMCFYVPGENLLFAGDTLFLSGVGRTDLWGGSFPELQASIREHLYALPEDTTVIAGHGPDTSIGAERRSNPFVRP
jgi:glyoxylase-like metal-dependent hydrolase (beta-lactamase superfamily II)